MSKLTIYGTNWCPHTTAARTALEQYHPLYVDCDKEADQCKREHVSAYPVVKNGPNLVRGWPTDSSSAAPLINRLKL
jgi:glutaredoxin